MSPSVAFGANFGSFYSVSPLSWPFPSLVKRAMAQSHSPDGEFGVLFLRRIEDRFYMVIEGEAHHSNKSDAIYAVHDHLAFLSGFLKRSTVIMGNR